jgi:twinkle protein
VVPQTADKIDPENDDKFKFLVNNWDRLAKVKRIIIAVDDDESGQRLAAELVRRLGRVRCSFVTYPTDRVVPLPEGGARPCKDLNEVKHHLGAEAVVRTLLLARPYPMSGLFRLYDFPQEQPIVYHNTGWRALDAHLRPFYPALMTITGLAGAGKSTFAMQLGIDMARIHKWPLAIASPEMARLEVVDTLRRAYLRDNPNRCSIEEVEDVDEWINSSVVFIDPDPVEDETHDVRWFLDRAAAAVVRYGCRQVILDPWNEIEHQRTGSENITEYTSRALRDIKAFNRSFGCMTTIVAHPSAKAADKRPDQIGLYDVSDSAHFANKSDIGIVVTRLGSNGEGASLGSIGVRKIKYQGTDKGGYLGTAQLMFDEERRVFFD